ncbi:MAG: SRPBCC domain-containing protein [Rhodobacteraceae bacterium]|nr:SRPBCC domain-containing protein [Paracoccaceae bacterium]
MKEVSTAIFIPVKPDRVWRQIAGFRNYGKWNPFIVAIEGELSVGRDVDVTFKLTAPDGQRSVNHKIAVRLVKIEEEHEIRWTHGSWLPGLLNFEHWMRIAPCKGGVKFHHTMRITGLMSGTLKDDYFAMYRGGFAAMNDALMARIESIEDERSAHVVANDNSGTPPHLPGIGKWNVG